MMKNIPYQTRCQMSHKMLLFEGGVEKHTIPNEMPDVIPYKMLLQALFYLNVGWNLKSYIRSFLWFVLYQTRPWTRSALCSEYLRCVSRNPGKRRINVTICHFITQPRTGKHALSTHCCHCCDIRSQIWKEYDICVLSFCTQHSTEAEPIMIKH